MSCTDCGKKRKLLHYIEVDKPLVKCCRMCFEKRTVYYERKNVFFMMLICVVLFVILFRYSKTPERRSEGVCYADFSEKMIFSNNTY